MFDANRILGQVLGSPATAGFAGGLAGGMLTSKSGRKMAKKVATYGGIAAVGALAYNAWQKHQQQAGVAAPGPAAPSPATATAPAPPQAAPAVPPPDSGFLPAADDVQACNALGLTLMRAMIAAANADGRLDGDEMQRILGRMGEMDLSAEDKALLMDELQQPVSINELVAAADGPEVATEIYVAALMAIDVDTAGEQLWLRELATRLRLPQDVVQSVHDQVVG
jgi:uncharacterized membrane protein YebE (DUF533 family)